MNSSPSVRLAPFVSAALVCVVALWIAIPVSNANTIVTVAPGHMEGWNLAVYGAGDGEFVNGPGSPPMGSGSVRYFAGPVAADDGVSLFTNPNPGIPIADVTQLAYSTYVISHGLWSQSNAVFVFLVDFDGAPPYTYSESVMYNPRSNGYGGELLLWKAWDVRNADVIFPMGQPGTTWDLYVQAHPSAVIYGLGVNVGVCPDGINENVEVCVDSIAVGVLGEVTTYNLELEWTTAVLADLPALSKIRANLFPNPVRGHLRYELHLPEPVHVRLSVFDAAGRLVRSLANADHPTGNHVYEWSFLEGSTMGLGSGVYILRAEAGSWRESRRFVVVE